MFQWKNIQNLGYNCAGQYVPVQESIRSIRVRMKKRLGGPIENVNPVTAQNNNKGQRILIASLGVQFHITSLLAPQLGSKGFYIRAKRRSVFSIVVWFR